MAISEKLEQALNKQLNEELFSSYLYLSMAADFEDKNYTGFASWMRVQFQEEQFHAMKFYDYIVQRGGKVLLEQIAKPKSNWETPLSAFKAAFLHETLITKKINNLVNLSREENDHATESFLKWFVDEQVEEEASSEEVVKNLEMIHEDKSALFLYNRELGKRVFQSSSTE